MKYITLEKCIVFLFFLSFFLIGIAAFEDYGISIDEDNLRIVGFLSIETVGNFFSLDNLVFEINKIIENNSEAHPRDEISTSGIVFDFPMSLIEYVFNIKDSRNYFLLRHFSTFAIFYTSVYFFYRLIKKKYNSVSLALIGCLFLILSPRIFANSFYNSKDIIFMSLLIISLTFTFKFIKNDNLLNSIILSFIYSLMINLRILGIIFPLLSSIFFIIYFLRQDKASIRNLINFLIFYIFLIIFSIILSPVLWENTLLSISEIFNFLKDHFLKIYVFYLGEFFFITEVPWHYHIIWILISTPIPYLLFFILGFFIIALRFFRRLFEIDQNNSYKDLWRGDKELEDVFFLFSWIIPVLIFVEIGMLRYNDWRHLYFTYPLFILISITGIYRLNLFFKSKKQKILNIILILSIFPTMYWMIKNHPYQNVYFNILASKNFNKKFEMDYWGLSNKQALEFLINIDNGDIKVMSVSTSDLRLSKKILKKKQRERIYIMDNFENSDYLVDTHYSWKAEKPSQDILDNYYLLYEIKVDGIPVNSIYKKKGLE